MTTSTRIYDENNMGDAGSNGYQGLDATGYLKTHTMPGHMVEIHVSPYVRNDLDQLAAQMQVSTHKMISNLIYAHFETMRAELQVVVSDTRTSQVFITYFVGVSIAMALVGQQDRVRGFLLHKSEANTLQSAIDRAHETTCDLGWIKLEFAQPIDGPCDASFAAADLPA